MSEQLEYEINVLEYWRILKRRRKFIFAVTAAAFAVAVIISLLLPKTYLSKASIMPPQQGGSLAGGLASALPSEIGSIAGLFGMETPSDIWLGILKSQSIKDAIIERFNLKTVYEKETMDDTIMTLDKAVSINKTEENIIAISVEDKNPLLAAEIANAYIEELDKVNRKSMMTSGSRTRSFIESALKETKVELARAEEDLRDFMKKHKTIDIDEQSKALVESTGMLAGQLAAKEITLKTLLSYSAPTNPQVQLLKTEVDEMKVQLTELQGGGGDLTKDGFVIPAGKIPDLSLRYARLLRNAKFQQAVYELLMQQYEMARIQEAKDTPTVQVLDVARAAEKKHSPKRVLIVAVTTMMAFFFSIFAAFLLEYVTRLVKPDHA